MNIQTANLLIEVLDFISARDLEQTAIGAQLVKKIEQNLLANGYNLDTLTNDWLTTNNKY